MKLENCFKENSLYLIAEIGGNHQGSFEKALELCELAINSDADCIKFQLYTAENLVNPLISDDRYKHFKKFELTEDQHIQLAKKCIQSGKDYTASIWDMNMVSFIEPYIKFFKIGSGDLTCREYLRRFAVTGKPIILSTGLSNEKEVHEAIKYIREVNNTYFNKGKLVIMQCTSMYPIEDADANLSVISNFSKIDHIIPGYSDHTRGNKALINSVLLGAKVLEFHFTDNKNNATFRDHLVSLELEDVIQMKKDAIQALEMIGDPEKKPLEIEIKNGHLESFRRAIYPKKDIEKGEKLSKDNIICLRPCKGIGAEYYDEIIGKELLVSIKKFQALDWNILR